MNNDVEGDEEIDLSYELQADLQEANVQTWPGQRYAYLKFGWDRTLKKQLQSEGTTFPTWIDSVMTHVQTHYRHSSLPTKIQFKVLDMENNAQYRGSVNDLYALFQLYFQSRKINCEHTVRFFNK